MRALQKLHNAGFYVWNARVNRAYRGGIILLLLAVMLVLIPPDHIGVWRGIGIAVASAAVVSEAMWVGSTWLLRGSPTMTYNDQPDRSARDTPSLWIRERKTLRRIARLYVPPATH